MPPLSHFEAIVVHALEETRSVHQTAQRLHVALTKVQRVAMMAYGLGHLEVELRDF